MLDGKNPTWEEFWYGVTHPVPAGNESDCDTGSDVEDEKTLLTMMRLKLIYANYLPRILKTSMKLKNIFQKLRKTTAMI